MQTFVKNERVQMLAVALATAVGAAFKINPFSNDFFRVGLGVSTFLLFLLLMRHLSYIKTGIITGGIAAAFQAGEWMLQMHSFSIMAAVQNNVAAGLYYVVFALAMSRIKKGIHEFQPLLLGGIISVIDFLSNVTELVIRGLMLGNITLHLDQWFFLLIVAVLRSYFVIGLYSSLSISQMRIVHMEQQKRMEQMLTINAGLYGEVFYLKKSMDTIESITVNSYFLYSKLKDDNLNDYGRQALGITQQIHEVKKDSQRILAGLLKLFDSEIVVDMNLSEILHYVMKANKEYSEMLHKQIIINKELESNYNTSHYIPLLTLLNNLVSNAVEATVKEGTINIHIFEQGKETFFVISDTGKGILEKNKNVIFEPGFTTKFNEEGIAATGIGLSHVRDIIQSFGGQIEVQSSGQGSGSKFIVHLPTARLKKNV
jgi:two-component system sensor histidine kinase YcbA